MKSPFLLITDPRKRSWLRVVEEALAPLGKLDIEGEGKASRLIQHERYKIIIIDTSHIKDLSELFLQIEKRLKDTRVVVATAKPDWKEARQAFRLGAVDYIHRPMTVDDLRSRFRAILEQSLKKVS